MPFPPLVRGLLRALARAPFSSGLAVVVLTVGLVTGSTWNGLRNSVGPQWGVSADTTVFSGNWATVVAALVIPRGVVGTLFSIVGILTLLAVAERLLGSRRTALIWLFLGTAGIAVGVVLQALATPLGEVWTEFSAQQRTVAPLIGVVGPLLVASAVAPALWKRRIRLWSFAALTTLILYGGSAASLYASISAVLGYGMGFLISGRRRLGRPKLSSARETRRLFATWLALTAIGPVFGVLRRDTDSPLAPIVTLIERQNTIFVLLALVLVAAFGLSRGSRWGYFGALGLTLMVAILGFLRVDFSLLLGDRDLPSASIETLIWNAVLILLPLCFAGALLAWRDLILVGPAEQNAPHGDRALARKILEQSGGTLSYMTMWPGNRYWFRPDLQGYVAYRQLQGVALTCGDPVCADELVADTIQGFLEMCDRADLTPAFYSASSRLLPAMGALGWSRMSVGEETIVTTAGLDFSGPQWSNVRNSNRRAERDGLRAVWTTWSELSFGERAQIVAISEQWVSEKALPELGFTLGSLSEIDDPHVRLMLVVGLDERILAVTSWLPSYHDGGLVAWTNDFMRRSFEATGRVMEFAISYTALQCARDGIAEMSLSGAPLAAKPIGHPADAAQPEVLRRFGAALAHALEPVYGFRSLFAFKSKFNPRYRTLWLFTPDPLAYPAVAIAIIRAYLPRRKRRVASVELIPESGLTSH